MNKIISKEHFSEKVFKLVVDAPLIAKSRKAGHFVIVRVGEKGERMPLTIAEADPVKGTITLVVQEVGLSSTRLCELNEGDYITDVVGPLGKATHIENFGTVVCAGGGVGVAPMLPIVQALKAAGNRVITVLAGRSKELIILEKEMRESSDEVIIMTDEGSYGKKGLVTEGIEEVIKREKVDKCFAIRTIIGHNNYFIRTFSHFFFQNDQLLRAARQYSNDTVSSSLQSLNNRQHRSYSYSTSSTNYCSEVLDVGCFTQRTYYIGNIITLVQFTQTS
jgi:NAD(P)H-flavin reductase